MDDAPRNLVLLQGGRKEGDGAGSVERLPRDALRLIPGGPAGDLQAAIEETVLEERIARALEELF